VKVTLSVGEPPSAGTCSLGCPASPDTGRSWMYGGIEVRPDALLALAYPTFGHGGRRSPSPLERNRPGRLPAAGGSARRNGWPFQALRGSPSHSDRSVGPFRSKFFSSIPGAHQVPSAGCPESQSATRHGVPVPSATGLAKAPDGSSCRLSATARGRQPALAAALADSVPLQALPGSPSHPDHSIKISIEDFFVDSWRPPEPFSGVFRGSDPNQTYVTPDP